MKKVFALILAAAMALSLLAACGGGGGNAGGNQGGRPTDGLYADPKYGGHLNVPLASPIDNTDPHEQTNVWRYMWASCVWENPLTRDADNVIRPAVCDYELSEDKLTIKLWVREGKTFSNGEPVEIEDVKASIDRACGGLFASGKTYIKAYTESSTIEGDVLTIKFKEYNEKTMYYLASYQTWMGVLPKEICDKYGQRVIATPADAIGTGPYVVTDFVQDQKVALKRRDDFKLYETEWSGQAGTKYAYMDTIDFHYFSDYNAAALALMGGTYDVLDDIDESAEEIARAAGITVTQNTSNTGISIVFNTYGDVACAKYPSLRKAICAAIDYEEYCYVRYGEGGYRITGNFCLGEDYATDIFDKADYHGAQNLELAKKYVEMAKQEGWDPDKEPVLVICSASENIDFTMLPTYLKAAGIKYTAKSLEDTARGEILGNPTGAWDFKITFPGLTFSPASTTVDFMELNYNSAAKKALEKELNDLSLTKEERIEKWHELAELMVDECIAVNMGFVVWQWWHPEDLNTNDEGVARYFYNSYWDNPAAHPKK